MTRNDVLDDLSKIATGLILERNLGELSSLVPLTGGRNNRAFRVEGQGGPWLLKQYFSDSSGLRDRRAAEWAWSQFCWTNGVTCVPEPLATDPANHTSLFEYVHGRPLQPDEVSEQHVKQAAGFVAQVNRHREQAAASQLLNAAEACFSIEEHIHCVDRRVHRLVALPASDSLDQELQNWMKQSLVPAWQTIESRIRNSVVIEELLAVLPKHFRCLSPSDFGFHNALLDSKNRLRFFDFEYAGWDDPAKLVCDFFWQPQCPAPRQCQPVLIAALVGLGRTSILEQRVDQLFPLYGIKWCCLILNEFVAADRRRREFASRPIDDRRREEQLERAKRLLETTCLQADGNRITSE